MAKVPTREGWTAAARAAAKVILLEPSPYGVDGGELIGRDPRRIPLPEFQGAGIAIAPIMSVVRAKCLDCCGEQADEVRKCVLFTCPNWPYRMGANPFRTQNLTPEERERRAARLRKRDEEESVEEEQ